MYLSYIYFAKRYKLKASLLYSYENNNELIANSNLDLNNRSLYHPNASELSSAIEAITINDVNRVKKITFRKKLLQKKIKIYLN
jgi:predicted Zn-dependent peptidase